MRPSTFPLLMAHGGAVNGTENTLQAIADSLDRGVDIIEIDIRKSSDGVLFCYHGNVIEYIFHNFFFNMPFAQLKRRYHSPPTLSKVADLVDNRAILFLDIKDQHITAQDLRTALSHHQSAQIYVAKNSLRYFEQLFGLPDAWVTVYNVGMLFPRRSLHRIKKAGLSIVEVFRWNYHAAATRLRQIGVHPAVSRWLFTKRAYKKFCSDHKTFWVIDY